ncbi:MAG: Hsp70 family protein, partial [Pseudobdellovibrionaceae bacterium]
MGSNVMVMPRGITLRLNHPAHIVHLKEKETYEFIREVKKCSLTKKDAEAVERLFILIEDQQIFPFFENIEKTKRILSLDDSAEFLFNYPGLEINESFTNKQFTEWSCETRENIFQALDQCLKDANLTSDQVDLVCLTGGTAKVPFIQKEFEKRFGVERLQTQSHFHSVLSGLTEAAAFLAQGKVII